MSRCMDVYTAQPQPISERHVAGSVHNHEQSHGRGDAPLELRSGPEGRDGPADVRSSRYMDARAHGGAHAPTCAQYEGCEENHHTPLYRPTTQVPARETFNAPAGEQHLSGSHPNMGACGVNGGFFRARYRPTCAQVAFAVVLLTFGAARDAHGKVGGHRRWAERAALSAADLAGASSAESGELPWAQPKSLSPSHPWMKVHMAYTQEVKAAEAAGERYEVVAYGDSLVESWRGTMMGAITSKYKGVPSLWSHYIEHHFPAIPLGISGDGAQQLMWRILNGELISSPPPLAIVLSIGRADVVGEVCTGNATALEEVCERINQIIKYLGGKAPNAHIILLGLLPKGETWPNLCTAALEAINMRLAHLADESQSVHFLDCSENFIVTNRKGHLIVNTNLLADSMHPTALGMEAIAKRLLPLLTEIIGDGTLIRNATLASDAMSDGMSANNTSKSRSGSIDGVPRVHQPRKHLPLEATAGFPRDQGW